MRNPTGRYLAGLTIQHPECGEVGAFRQRQYSLTYQLSSYTFSAMHDMKRLQPAFSHLATFLEKYLRVSRIPQDFVPGETLYPTEIHVISWIVEHGPCAVSEIGQAFGTTKGASSQIVGKLTRRGFLRKSPDPDKRSRVLVSPTAKGRTAHDRHMQFHMRHDRVFLEYLSSLPPEQITLFEQLCRQMTLWMDGYLEGQPKHEPRS